MINFYLDSLLFYIATVFFFLTASGYGKIIFSYFKFSKTELNFFELNFFGNVFYLILGFILSISIGFSLYLNLSIAFIGLFLFFFLQERIKYN